MLDNDIKFVLWILITPYVIIEIDISIVEGNDFNAITLPR